MADMFADNLVKKIIGEIITNKDKLPDNKNIWFQYTKLMFRNYPSFEVYHLIEQAFYEVSDENWFENKYPASIFKEKRVKSKGYIYSKGLLKELSNKLKINEVAESYGIIIKKNKALCPFHKEKEPSLTFNLKTNTFKCWGCNKSGNIIKFVKLMEELKSGEFKGS